MTQSSLQESIDEFVSINCSIKFIKHSNYFYYYHRIETLEILNVHSFQG